ncbi:hypothetical protein SAMN06265339_1092 [Desulfurobacterium pacificum]|uniref:Uncharacterized protein n=1 Tax=Desulfurobacterium pacificum TaxID=240166 RepID=A0ABY1NM78_9BACT|nr:hypothetical protein SAMN06265339_1092 [Desulfurobacterium pacificum]
MNLDILMFASFTIVALFAIFAMLYALSPIEQ